MPAAKPYTLYLISDGTCRTCETVVRAVLVQFPKVEVVLTKKAHVRKTETVRAIIQQAAQERALVFYTLVYDRARVAAEEAAREHMVIAVDLLGPVLVSLSDLFKMARRHRPGLLYRMHRAQFDRLDAVEYTLAHDDGRRLCELKDADVVLVGISRVAKSTTCFYLAYSGIRAANVPLLPGEPPPAELVELDPRRVIGLTVNPYRLKSIRESRLKGWSMDVNHLYAHKAHIAHELRMSHELMNQHGWRCVDTSYKGIEEIAREVRQLLTEAGIEVGHCLAEGQ